MRVEILLVFIFIALFSTPVWAACMERDILISMRDTVFKLPRDHLNIRLKSGELLYPSSINEDCSIKKIENVASVLIPKSYVTEHVLHVELSDAEMSEKHATSYSRAGIGLYPERAKDLASGKISEDDRIYFIPLNLGPTANNQPVVFECGDSSPSHKTSYCDVSYFISKNILISYRFFRGNVPIDAYIKLNKEVRNKIEQMKVAARKN